jgi:predicted phage gp36 major capsid-like protein
LAAVGESGSRAKPKKLSAMQRIGKLPAKEQAWLYHLMAAWTELKPDEQLKALSWIRDTDSGLTDDGRDRVNGMIDRRRTALQ